MGRLYKPVEISFNGKNKIIIGLIDTGVDETVVSEKLAKEFGAVLYGTYKAVCASQFMVTGKYADLTVWELKSGKEITIKVGISDTPFDTDEIDEEGLNVILGVDFIQKTNLNL